MPNNEGVEIDAGATGNLIGTNGDGVNDAAEQNLISGNLFAGVGITGQGTASNAVAGNFLGTDLSGSVALKNGTQGVSDSLGNYFGGGVAISAGASSNRIGTNGKSVDDVGERNVIAGSGNDGIDIWGTGTDGNVVAGNFVGTDITERVRWALLATAYTSPKGPPRIGSGSIRQADGRFRMRATSSPGMGTMASRS